MSAHSSKHHVPKRKAGRTAISETPLRIRVSGVDLTPQIKEGTHALLGRRLARFGPWIERVDVRFKDINGPARGGPDTRCRINLAVSGRPSVFAEERAHDVDRALFRAASSVSRAMARSVERKGFSAPPLTRPAPQSPKAKRSAGNGESTRAAPARGRRRIRGMVYKLEESATTPSRKSSRKSKSGLKTGNKLTRRAQRRTHAPKARATRAARQRRRARR